LYRELRWTPKFADHLNETDDVPVELVKPVSGDPALLMDARPRRLDGKLFWLPATSCKLAADL
jgi:hypothetical protein